MCSLGHQIIQINVQDSKPDNSLYSMLFSEATVIFDDVIFNANHLGYFDIESLFKKLEDSFYILSNETLILATHICCPESGKCNEEDCYECDKFEESQDEAVVLIEISYYKIANRFMFEIMNIINEGWPIRFNFKGQSEEFDSIYVIVHEIKSKIHEYIKIKYKISMTEEIVYINMPVPIKTLYKSKHLKVNKTYYLDGGDD